MEHINRFAKVKKCVEKISGVDDAGNETACYEITLQFNDMNRGEYLRLVRAAILDHTVQVAVGFPQAEMAMNVSRRDSGVEDVPETRLNDPFTLGEGQGT